MSKTEAKSNKAYNDPPAARRLWRRAAVLALLVLSGCATEPPRQQTPARTATPPPAPVTEQPKAASELVTMDVAKAVMVTVELDFGPKPPSIAQALTDVERRYQPDD